jgi:hypothetical protein
MHSTKQSLLGWVKGHRKLVSVLSVLVVLGGAGSAAVFAAIPDSNGVIHACYTTSGLLPRVRIIDNASQSCNSNETAISWNQQGPQGPAGPQGPTGPQGPAGEDGDNALVAKAYVKFNTTTQQFDLGYGQGITAVYTEGSGTSTNLCLVVTPQPAYVLQSAESNLPRAVAIKNASTWSDEDPGHCQDYPDANVWAAGPTSKYMLFYQ